MNQIDELFVRLKYGKTLNDDGNINKQLPFELLEKIVIELRSEVYRISNRVKPPPPESETVERLCDRIDSFLYILRNTYSNTRISLIILNVLIEYESNR